MTINISFIVLSFVFYFYCTLLSFLQNASKIADETGTNGYKTWSKLIEYEQSCSLKTTGTLETKRKCSVLLMTQVTLHKIRQEWSQINEAM